MPWLWAVFTVAAAGGQVLRNAMQKELTADARHGRRHARALPVRAAVRAPLPRRSCWWRRSCRCPQLNAAMIAWTVAAALAQIAATALLLAAMQARSFVVTTAYAKTEPVQVAVFGLAFLGDKVTPGQGLAILIATAGVLIVSWPRSNARGGLLLEAGGARHRLGRAVCHCRHRLSRRHPGARGAELRGRRHHDAGAGPRHPDGDADRLSGARRPAGAGRRSSAPGGRRCLPASWAPSPRRCGSWPSRSRRPPRCARWRWSRSCSRRSCRATCSSRAWPPARRPASG